MARQWVRVLPSLFRTRRAAIVLFIGLGLCILDLVNVIAMELRSGEEENRIPPVTMPNTGLTHVLLERSAILCIGNRCDDRPDLWPHYVVCIGNEEEEGGASRCMGYNAKGYTTTYPTSLRLRCPRAHRMEPSTHNCHVILRIHLVDGGRIARGTLHLLLVSFVLTLMTVNAIRIYRERERNAHDV